MGEIIKSSFGSYAEYKAQFDATMKRTVGNFVSIGYFLMVARDTNILEQTQYKGMGEFAKAEYGLTESQTSRFIAVAEKYGDAAGNVLPDYRQYSFSLLSEMLTLPDAVAEEITPEYTREEVRALKSEIAEEEKVTDLEVLMEGRAQQDDVEIIIHDYLHGSPEEFKRAFQVRKTGLMKTTKAIVLDALAPSGVAILAARIQGKGRVLLSFKGLEQMPVKIITRTGEKEEVSWEAVFDAMERAISYSEDCTEAQCWQQAYGEEWPEKEEPKEPPHAEASTSEPIPKAKPKKEKKIKIAPAQKKPEPVKEEPAKEEPPEQVAEEILPPPVEEGPVEEEPEVIHVNDIDKSILWIKDIMAPLRANYDMRLHKEDIPMLEQIVNQLEELQHLQDALQEE